LPYTGIFVLLASLSISALPPFNGFVSEWLTFQSLFQMLTSFSIGLKILAMLSVAALGMAGAMAAACFIKFIGIAFLGLPRSEQAQNAHEVPITMLIGIGLLVMLCLLAGLFPQFILMLVDSVTQELFAISVLPDLRGFSFLPYFPLRINNTEFSPIIVLFLGIAFILVFYTIIKVIGRNTKERLFKTWDCSFGGLSPRMQYTATGFSKPLRIVFRVLYRPKRELQLKKGPSDGKHVNPLGPQNKILRSDR
jgi:NADH:ubiquinone oxidoreductase subunit 5 (subunit L)/multisubunit Na+/H+ antiporter MnhA subunit